MATKTTLPKSEPKRKQHNFRPRLFSLFVLLIALGLVFSSGSVTSLSTLASKRRTALPEPQGNGYTYRRTITIDHTKVPNTDQSNFPVLISGAYSYLATTGNGGNVQNANGYDVIFTSDTGCATKLNHEVETYNATTGAVNYWVKVPTASHASDTMFYMCYGNSSITTDQSNTTAVWDANYKGVYHLPNGATISAADSSSNANNGTISNATATLGQMDGAASFNGSNAQVVVGSVSLSSPMTVSLWLKETQRTDGGGNPAYGNMIFFGNVGYLEASSNNGLLYFAGAAASWTSTGYTIPLNTWTHLEFVSTSSTLTVFANGSQVYSTSSDHFSNLNSYFDLATWGQSVGWFHGSMDELRISSTSRSGDWIATEYNDQSSPSTFYSISPASGGGNQSPISNAGGPYSGTVGSAVQFNGSGSYDPDGTIASYSWTFGDGGTGSGATPTHTYASAGTYTATLTVTDNAGATGSANATVTITGSGGSLNGYSYRRSFTIDHTKVPNTDQSNFPALISGAYSYLATTSNGGNVRNANGYDVIFTSDAGCATKLNHEVETYNAGTGAVNYWVRVPTVSHTTDTVFYMCYGNSSITTDQSNKTAVWDGNFKGVWHLPNGTALATTDSTANANNGSSNSASATSGVVDGAASFNGSSQYTVISNPASFDFEYNQPFSVELWMKKPLDTSRNQVLLSKQYVYWSGPGYQVWTWAGSNNAIFTFLDSAGNWYELDSIINAQDNAWHHIVATYDGSSNRSGMKMYADGTLTMTGPSAPISNTIRNSYNLIFGTNAGSFGDYYNGSLDEVRISSSARSADWIKTEYNNQSSPSTFYSISPASSSGNQSPVANAAGPYSGTVGSAVQFNGSGSYDPDGTISNYSWTFGDGGSGSGATPTHTYASAGTYTAALTVTDNGGVQSSANATVTISGGSFHASADFSSTQGYRNWYYLESTGVLMNYVAANNWWQGSETYSLLWPSGGHPGDSVDVVRQWRAPTAGTIHITGNASDGDPNCGDGVIVSIKKGTQALWQQTIDNGNTAGFSYDLTTTVVVGDQINFVINKRIANNWCDSTTFDPTITYVSGGNQSPIANIGGPYSGTVGNAVSFNGSASYDPDGSIANYSWAFGDGGSGSGATPTHSYTSEGIYTTGLTVTDNRGAQSSATTSVTICQGGSPLVICNHGFELPSVGSGANSYVYGPTGGMWTFAGNSGVSGNGSGFTSGNASAPEGSQVAFLQIGSSSVISQSIAGFQANTNYTVTFSSAQRGNCCNDGGQDFQVYLDNTLLGTFHPSGTSYADYSTPAFTTTAGAHTLKFVGVNSLGGDHSAFIDNVRIANGGGPPTAGLAGYWKFDENTGAMAADSSGNGNNGTLTSGASWGTGQSGSAVSLDGVNAYVQVGARPGLVMTSGFTVGAWIYPTGGGSNAPYGGILVNKEGEYEIARFADGSIQWAFANSNPGWAWINTGFVAPLNQWSHITVTYDNGVIKTYANGVLTHTYSGSGSIGDVDGGSNDFRVGGRQCCSQNFQGRIDEVRVYNRALTASEVATLPNGSSSSSATFVRTDTTTQGNWKGVYGAEGYNIISDSTNYPAYAQVSVTGQLSYTWAASTSDPRALLKAASSSDRVAACWYSGTTFTVDVNITDGNTHRLAIYTLDWDGNNGRTGRIDVLDAANDAVLDTRDLSAYSSGKYFVWQMRGHVKIRLTHLSPAGWNQVISGLFFDPPNGNQPPVANAGGPYSGMTGTPIQFNGSSSYDPDGSIISYSWNFGDGGTASGATSTHAYASAGTYNVALTVADNNGATASATTTATVTSPNQPPVANAGGPYSGTAGTAIQFNGSGSYDPDGTISNYSWAFGDGGTGSGATPTHAYTSVGTYTATLTVTDNSGAQRSATAAATISAPNQPPVANAGGPYSGTAGTAISFNAGSSYDPDGTITNYSWNFGDGGTGSGTTPTHIYTSAGTYTITLTVTDNGGRSASSNASATVSSGGSNLVSNSSFETDLNGWDSNNTNVPCWLNPGATLSRDNTTSVLGSYSLKVGSPGQYYGARYALSGIAGHNYRVSAYVKSDGTNYVQLGLTSDNTCVGASPYTASSSWTLLQGNYSLPATGNMYVVVRSLSVVALNFYVDGVQVQDTSGDTSGGNQLPVARTGGPYSGTVGTAIQFNGSSSYDPDGTITNYSWSFGDGGTSSGVTPTHTYASAGTYTASLTVTDNGGAQGSATATVTVSVTNQPPVANAGGPYSGTVGTAIQFNGSGSYDSDGTISNYSWAFGDGGTGSGAALTHAYASGGTYTAVLTVTDNSGATVTANASVTVNDGIDPRLDPMNRTGGVGEDPLSRNFNWSLPIVSLPGRGGMDLGLSLAYNSLATWLKQGSVISFDNDHGFPGPGFRLGFPVIQPAFYNSPAHEYSYVLLTPSGSHVELRQVGTSSLYQSVDSSYLLLDASALPTMTLKAPDGTRMSYVSNGSDYVCTKIEDRNGNYITINYDGLWRIDTVIDTLSRTIKFKYETGGDLSSITQTWTVNGQPQEHLWALFFYADKTIQTNFQGLTVSGPQNGSTIHVLTGVELTDASFYSFDYTSWGQVWKISKSVFYEQTLHDGTLLLNYQSYNLPQTNDTALTDCPRFTERRDWAENWNGDTDDQPATNEEAVTTFAVPATASWTMPDGAQNNGTVAQVAQPDGTYEKLYSHSSGWDKGLTLLAETYGSSNPGQTAIKQRSVVTSFTQDNTSVGYLLNPRVQESHVYDFNSNGQIQNHARTRIEYISFILDNDTSTQEDDTTVYLPENVKEYQANATTVLRRTHTAYKSVANNPSLLDPTYANRRIIGLVSERALYEVDSMTGVETLSSRVAYGYDESTLQNADAAVKHDTLSYVSGRANLTSVTRYDVTNVLQPTTSTMEYNTAGSVVRATDASGHQTQFSYTDQFAANGTSLDSWSLITLAYPTTVTDPDGSTTQTRYRYDFGAPTWKQTPLPNATDNQPGPQQVIAYDDIGRLQRVTSLANSAYTRYVYGPNYVETFATVNNVADEAHSLHVLDGAGRVIAKASNHPGSVGGYSGQLLIYDAMGRVIKQSNPTETSITISNPPAPIQPYSWYPTGDDDPSTLGHDWLYTQQTYDWKSRPLVSTNPDNTKKTASYNGCGCAGGEVVTLTDEGTVDPATNMTKRRQEKIYHDVLGRTVKTEVLNWEGGSVYSTTVNTYNARDQVTLVRQYQGTDVSGAYQATTMTYDGYGRLQSKHAPEQDSDKATVYAYNPDDTIQKVTSARGTSATYGYNSRHLVTGITYSVPQGSNIPATPDVSFGYDAAGNRTSMTDGSGSTNSVYDALSRMQSETRQFTGANAPAGAFTITYGYNLAGQLTSITDPFNEQVSYQRDSSGRVQSMGASGYTAYYHESNYNEGSMEVTQPASNIQYRAWGAIKQLTFGNNVSETTSFNARLQPTQFVVSNVRTETGSAQPPFTNPSVTMVWTYDYHADGRPHHAFDQQSHASDRRWEYDQSARLSEAYINHAARGEVDPNYEDTYRQNIQYDVWNNITARTGMVRNLSLSDTATWVNNRRTSQYNLFSYDAEGNLMDDTTGTSHTYDAAGLQTHAQSNSIVGGGNFPAQPTAELTQSYDGLGAPAIHDAITRSEEWGYDGNGKAIVTGISTDEQKVFYVRSTVLGGKLICEVVRNYNGLGAKLRASIYLGGRRIARDGGYSLEYEHQNPINGSWVLTNAHPSWRMMRREERDPFGADMARIGQAFSYANSNDGGYPEDWRNGCEIDGVPVDCSLAKSWLNSENSERVTTIAYYGRGVFNGWIGVGQRAGDDPLPGNSTPIDDTDDLESKRGQWGNASFWAGIMNGSVSFGVGYSADTYSNDEGLHDVSSAYHVTIFGGAEYFVAPQNPELQDPQNPELQDPQNPVDQRRFQHPQRPKPTPKTGPSAEGIRMGKLVDCLKDARDWYARAQAESERNLSEAMHGPLARLAYALAAVLTASPAGAAEAYASNAALQSAYHSGREIGNYQQYRRLEANCHKSYGGIATSKSLFSPL